MRYVIVYNFSEILLSLLVRVIFLNYDKVFFCIFNYSIILVGEKEFYVVVEENFVGLWKLKYL